MELQNEYPPSQLEILLRVKSDKNDKRRIDLTNTVNLRATATTAVTAAATIVIALTVTIAV